MVKEPARMGVKQNYRLFIDTELYQYMMVLARESAPNEITGIGMISKKCYGNYTDFVLEEVIVPEQLVSSTYCTFKEGAQNEIINNVIEVGENLEKLCFRWHSHANGSVYFSPRDENDIDHCDSPYVVNMVVNAKYDKIARLDILEPVRVRNIPVDIVIEPASDMAFVTECRAEIAHYCEPIPQKPKAQGGWC